MTRSPRQTIVVPAKAGVLSRCAPLRAVREEEHIGCVLSAGGEAAEM